MKLPLDSWPIIFCGCVFSAVFCLFGVNQLIASYGAEEPYSFLMLFFSSSMIILVNGTIFVVLVVIGIRKYTYQRTATDEENPPLDDANDTECS